MTSIPYYLVDVFTSSKYGGNQLAVFIDYDGKVDYDQMLSIARELNFAEITFITKNHDDVKFDVRIFTPEYEVPFAGHPSLGTAYVIAKYLTSTKPSKIILNLKQGEIAIDIEDIKNLENSNFIMEQAQPQFLDVLSHHDISNGLGINLNHLDQQMPIEEISTGLPYIIIHLKELEHINALNLDSKKMKDFLIKFNKYKTNSHSGLSTSFFFVTEETFESQNDYNTRMFLIENNQLMEDAATGSANGCFLAYLLKHKAQKITATVEQGFQKNRKSYINLNGYEQEDKYFLKVGGKVVEIGQGNWYI